MVLKQIKLGRLVTQRRDAEKHMKEMLQMIETAEKEQRSLTSEENKKFSSLEKQLEQIDAEFEKEGLTMEEAVEQLEDIKTRSKQTNGSLTNSNEYRALKRRSENPLEVRGYRGKEERVGRHDTDVTIGDLVYSHVTGKFRNQEVRQAMNTTGSGILIPTEVYNNFIDLLRDQNFLMNATIYPMASKALVIPKVVGDITAAFKAENELIVESAPVFDSVKLEAKPLYAMTSISLELLESAGLDIGMAVTNIMAASMAAAVQNFMLHGGGELGFEGILNDAAINKVDATDVNYAAIGAGIRAIRNANGVADGVVINSNDAMNLELLTDTTGQYIQKPSFMNNINMYDVSGAMVEGDAMVADFRAIAWGILSEGGLQIDIDRAGDAFNRGQIKIRARINSDFALTNPKLVSLIAPAAI
jgi:HK97 family phage major capsid protein